MNLKKNGSVEPFNDSNISSMVELAGRYSNPKTQQLLEALLSLKPTRDENLLRERNARKVQRQRRLTKDEVEEVVKSYEDGSSMQQLAKIWSIHRTTISRHIRKSGVPRRF